MNLNAQLGTEVVQRKLRSWYPTVRTVSKGDVSNRSLRPEARKQRGAAALARAWQSASSCNAALDEVYGRVVYLRTGADLSNAMLVDAHRRVAFVADGASWAGRNYRCGAREILLRNGVEEEWLNEELAQGTSFKLVLFDNDGTVWPADWEGVQRAVQTYHPKAAAKMKKHWSLICSRSWDELDAEAGADANRHSDRPMTEDKYLAAEDTPLVARRFLASTLSLNRNFQGTGFTLDERKAGTEATAEFFAPNRPLGSFPPDQVIDLDP